MKRLGDAKFGPRGKALRELTDKELADEVRRRRSEHAEDDSTEKQLEARSPKRIRQYLANLELSAGATLSEVERAYQRLRQRYDPAKHKDDPEKNRAARELTKSLQRAYQALREHLTR